MEMMQIQSAGTPPQGAMQGKMSKAAAMEGRGFFQALLNRQQADEIAGEIPVGGDPSALAAWLLPGWTPGVPAGTEGSAGDSLNSSQAGNIGPEGAGAGLHRWSERAFAGSGGPGMEAEGNQSVPSALPAQDGTTPVANASGAVPPEVSQAVQGIASGLPGQGMTAAPLRAGNRGRQTGEAHAPAKGLGVLEQRFAAILRPMEAASSDKGAPSAFAASTIQGDSTPPGAPALPAEALHPGGQTLAAVNEAKPATAPAETVASFPAAIDQGEISLNGEAPQGDMAGADSPDIPTPAAGPAGRTTVSTFTGNVAETAAGKPSVDRPMADSQILDQVIGRLSVDRNAEASRMSIKLQPEELGRIDIDLTVEQGRIKAQVVAQNQQVQDVLERHLPRLRESLEQQGLKLDQIQVSVDAHAGDSRGFSQQHHQRHADGHPRSWTGTHQGGPVVETEAPPPAALHPQGKLSLRI